MRNVCEKKLKIVIGNITYNHVSCFRRYRVIRLINKFYYINCVIDWKSTSKCLVSANGVNCHCFISFELNIVILLISEMSKMQK